MRKNFRIWGLRGSLAGDMTMSLPILNYLEQQYPNSYKYFVIHKKCSQFASLFINHPLIDCIRITENKESLGAEDIEIMKQCDLAINIAPQHPDGMPATTEESCWWNKWTLTQETFRMAGFDVNEYIKMPIELQYPKLTQWFDIQKLKNVIAIFPFSSYGVESKRSPSYEWWKRMIKLLIDNKYTVFHFGGENEPNFGFDLYYRFCHLPIFEQIKMALGCDLIINTDSGSGWIAGSYGARQITLLTNEAPNHKENLLAFAPMNYKNNNINVFIPGGFDNLNQEVVLETIKQFN